MTLDLVRLKQFIAVARERSIRRGAEILEITQPTVSRGIASLESAFSCQLLVRRSDGVELTPAGWLLLGHAISILERVDRAEKEMLQVSQKPARSARTAKAAKGKSSANE